MYCRSKVAIAHAELLKEKQWTWNIHNTVGVKFIDIVYVPCSREETSCYFVHHNDDIDEDSFSLDDDNDRGDETATD